MRRVQVESPFAPQTPLVKAECPFLVDGYPNDCRKRAMPDVTLWCERCRNVEVRAQESARNARYLAACLRDCIKRGETPYASHGLLTLPGVLRDDVPEERALGIRAGFAMREAMHATVFYLDFGWTRGMRDGEEHALSLHDHLIEYRTIGVRFDGP